MNPGKKKITKKDSASSILRDDDGRFIGSLSSGEDITERKQSEEALRKSEDKYRNLVEKINDVISSTDEKGVMTYISPPVKQILGYEDAEIIGKPFSDFIYKEDICRIKEQFDKIKSGKIEASEYRVVSKSGDIRWIRTSSRPVFSGKRFLGLQGTLTDITERKILENSLIDEKRKLATLISNVPGMVYRCHNDKFWTMEFISEGCISLTGYSPTDLINNSKVSFEDIIHPADRYFVRNEVQNALKKGDSFRLEYRIINSSGQEKWVFEHGRSIQDGKNNRIMLEGIITDINVRKEAENKLCESEKKYRTLFETMTQGVVYQDIDGNIFSANPASLRILGLSYDQMIGRTSMNPMWRAVHEDGSAFSGETHPALIALKTGKTVRNVVMGVFNPAKDDWVWININAIPQFRVGESKPYQVYTTFEDITEQKNMINELRSSEERFKILFEYAPDGYYLMDLNGNFIDGNQQAEKLVGDKRKNFIGKNMFDMMMLSNEDRKKALNALKKNKRGLSTEREEYTLSRKDGSQIVVEISTHPVKFGNESLVLGIARNITETKNMQIELENYRVFLEDQVKDRTERLNKALQDSETNRDRINTILKSVTEGLIVSDINHHIVMMNSLAEEWLDVRLSEVFNQRIELVFKEKKLQELIEKALDKHPESIRIDFEIRKEKKSEDLVLEASAKVIVDKDNNYLGVLTTLRDITQERKIDQMKTEFLSTAAHELRTPLTSIQGFSEVLLTRKDLRKSEKDKFIKYINKQAMNLGNIISDLLDISRIESGTGFQLKREQCQLNKIIYKLIDNYKISFPTHIFISNIIETKETLFADCNKIEQVLQNLIINAVNYTPAGGEIKIDSHVSDKMYRVTIEDNGIGMTKEQVKRIFEKFYRADMSDTAPKGTGLGMSIVKLIIEAHQGKIWVESELGKGTRVIFTLPVGLREGDLIVER